MPEWRVLKLLNARKVRFFAAAKVGLLALHVRMLVSGDRSYPSGYLRSTRSIPWTWVNAQDE